VERGCHARQSTATASAAQISCMRSSASRPSRSTRTASETLSTESRLTAERRGTGSSPGARITSLGSERIVVVHGAISARRRRGIATSRERITTGRRPISGSSHHHSSPRHGIGLTSWRQPAETTPGLPRHRADPRDDGHTRRTWRRSPPRGDVQAVPRALRRPRPRQSNPSVAAARRPAARCRRSCSDVCDSCHKYATGRSSEPRRPSTSMIRADTPTARTRPGSTVPCRKPIRAPTRLPGRSRRRAARRSPRRSRPR
jgi:hypothetical protein